MSTHQNGKVINGLAVVVVLGLLAAGAHAAAWNGWTGATSTDWNTATNWDQGHVPNSGDLGAIVSGAGAFRPSITTDPLNTVLRFYVGNFAGETMTISGGHLHVDAATNAEVAIGRGDGTFTGTLNMTGGALTTYATYLAGGYTGNNATGILNLSGNAAYTSLTANGAWPTFLVGHNGKGVLSIADNALLRSVNVTLGTTTSGSRGTLDLTGGAIQLDGCTNAGGANLCLGAGNANAIFNWGGGTIKLNSPTRGTNPVDYYGRDYGFNVQLNENLTGIGGNAKFDTNGYSTEMSGRLTGPGGFEKRGLGTLNMTGTTSAYLGDTIVSGGILRLAAATLNDTAEVYLSLGAALNLNYSGTDTIGGLFLNGVQQPIGVYDVSNSGGYITGNGRLNVTEAAAGDIPEPATLALLGLGIAGLGGYIRRRRAA